MINVQQLRSIGVLILVLILAFNISLQLVREEYMVVFAIFACLTGLIFTYSSPGLLVLVCISFATLNGRSALKIGYFEIFGIALVAHTLFSRALGGISFREIKGAFTLFCITVCTSILTYHGFQEESGKRLALFSAVTLAFCFLLQARALNLKKIDLLPWAGLIPGIILAAFDIINTIIPSAIPITVNIYDQQNWQMMADYSGQTFDFIRFQGVGALGVSIGILAITYFACDRQVHFQRTILYLMSIITGVGMAIASGYRSAVIALFLQIGIGAYTRSRTFFLMCALALCVAIGLIIVVQNSGTILPYPVQRSLCFLPGNWDPAIQTEADDGFRFRRDLTDIFFRQNFDQNPWFGRGLAYDESNESAGWMANSTLLQTQLFAYQQAWHCGWVSSLDFIGIVGTGFLILGCLRGLWNCLIILHSQQWMKRWHLYAALTFVPTMIFWVNGFVNASLPVICVFMSLLELAVSDIKQARNSLEIEPTKSGIKEEEIAGAGIPRPTLPGFAS